MKKEFLGGQIFDSLEDAQAQLDGWINEYNSDRDHQSLGEPPSRPALRPGPARPDSPWFGGCRQICPRTRSRLASSVGCAPTGRSACSTASTTSGAIWPARTSRSSSTRGSWSTSLTQCSSPPMPASTRPSCDDSLPSPGPRCTRQLDRSTDTVVIRKVDKNGAVRFAGTPYYVGQAHRRCQVEVALMKDTGPDLARRPPPSAPTPSATTVERSTVPSLTPVVDPTASMRPRTRDPLSPSSRSRSVTRYRDPTTAQVRPTIGLRTMTVHRHRNHRRATRPCLCVPQRAT